MYIDLEKIRFKTPFKSTFQIDPEIDPDDIQIPPMLIQPFVENAIRHGLTPKTEGAEISFHLFLKEEMLHIILTDNGIGREVAKKIKNNYPAHTSSGLPITFERIKLIKEKYDENVRIEIIDLYDSGNTPAGTKVEIILSVNMI